MGIKHCRNLIPPRMITLFLRTEFCFISRLGIIAFFQAVTCLPNKTVAAQVCCSVPACHEKQSQTPWLPERSHALGFWQWSSRRLHRHRCCQQRPGQPGHWRHLWWELIVYFLYQVTSCKQHGHWRHLWWELNVSFCIRLRHVNSLAIGAIFGENWMFSFCSRFLHVNSMAIEAIFSENWMFSFCTRFLHVNSMAIEAIFGENWLFSFCSRFLHVNSLTIGAIFGENSVSPLCTRFRHVKSSNENTFLP